MKLLILFKPLTIMRKVFFTLVLLTGLLAGLSAQETGVAKKKEAVAINLRQPGLSHQKSSTDSEEWYPLQLYAGEVTSVVRDPNDCDIAYAGTRDAGVFRTLDGGLTWIPAREGLTFVPIRELAIDPLEPARIYAGTDYDGIWVSEDSAKTWSQTSYNGEFIAFNILIDPADNSVIYAGEAGGIGLGVGHMFKSTDKGASWMKIENGLLTDEEYTNGIFSLALDPQDGQVLYAGTNYKGVYKSTDGGGSWSALTTGIPELSGDEFLCSANALSISGEHHSRPGALFNGNYYKYSSHSWQLLADGYIGQSIFPGSLEYYPGDSTRLFTDTYYSTDAGATWSEYRNSDTDSRIGFSDLSTHLQGCSVMYGGVSGNNGLAVSEDDGLNWTASSEGLVAATVYSVAINQSDPQNVYAGTTDHFYFSTDGGMSWDMGSETIDYGGGFVTTSYNFAYVSDIQINPNNNQMIYIATANGFYRSEDGGSNFTELMDAGSPSFIKMHRDSECEAIYTAGRGIQRSDDLGSSWTEMNTGLPTEFNEPVDVQCFAIDPSDSSKLWAGFWHFSGLYTSENGGESWTLAGLTDESIISAIAVDPADPQVLLAGAGFAEGKILKSTDGGQSWESKLEGIALPMEFIFDPRGSSQIYAATEGYGILRSSDYGETWEFYDQGIFYPVLYSMDISGDENPVLLAGTYGSGIYGIEPVFREPQSVPVLTGSSGWSIYPNPSNGRFSIYREQESLSNEQTIYSVCTLSGSIVAEINAGKSAVTTVDLSGLVPGIYLLKIKAEQRKDTRLLIIQ